jgi:hypothetical protein
MSMLKITVSALMPKWCQGKSMCRSTLQSGYSYGHVRPAAADS